MIRVVRVQRYKTDPHVSAVLFFLVTNIYVVLTSKLSDHSFSMRNSGWSMDGPAIYGRYLDASAPGYNVPLDDCGGHIHSPDTNSYGYHYHAQITNETVSSIGPGGWNLQVGSWYLSYSAGVYKCYKADISAARQPYFFTETAGPNANLVPVQPCCSTNPSTQAYLASGITLSTTAGTPSGGGSPAPSPSPSTKNAANSITRGFPLLMLVFLAMFSTLSSLLFFERSSLAS